MNIISKSKNLMLNKKFTEIQVQNILNILCQELGVPEVSIYPLSEIVKITDTRCLGRYPGKKFGTYVIELKNETDLKTALHELCHHIQAHLYKDYNDVHGTSFTLASGRVIRKFNKIFKTSYKPNVLR